MRYAHGLSVHKFHPSEQAEIAVQLCMLKKIVFSDQVGFQPFFKFILLHLIAPVSLFCFYDHRCQRMHTLQKIPGNDLEFSPKHLQAAVCIQRETPDKKFGQFLADRSDTNRINLSFLVNMLRFERKWLIESIRLKSVVFTIQ